jgi:HlyD family secretion protein
MTKKIILVILGLTVICLLVLALMPSPIPVSVAVVEKDYFAEYTADEGVARLRHTHVFSAPINGYLHRVELEPGDIVQTGDIVFTMEPAPAPGLDPRTLRQAREQLEAAQARLRTAEADYRRAVYQAALAEKELNRHEVLFDQNVISRATMDRVQNELELAVESKKSAKSAAEAAEYDVQNARAVLEVSTGALNGDDQVLKVKSPVKGVILRRGRYQEGSINSGEIVLETGNLDDLEVQVDLLSVEAVRVRPGMRVILEHWGEKRNLTGRVRLVEPAGFKRVSALGVDEQRVPVYVEIASPRDEWENLGHDYRVEARFILWEDDQVIHIPTSGLFRQDDQWYVFVIEDERAVTRQVKTGRRSGLLTQILQGLEPGEKVVTHPGDKLSSGARVKVEMAK